MASPVVKFIVKLVAGVAAVVALIAAFLIVSTWSDLEERALIAERLITVGWGDGKYGNAFYGAYVHYEPRFNGTVDVKLTLRIGRGSLWRGYLHEARSIGTARNPEEAVARYGVLTWSEEGLWVGDAPGKGYLFPRADMERHR